MSVQVMVNLPDSVYQRARRLSELTGRNIEDILRIMLELSLPSFIAPTDPSVELLSDAEVLTFAHLQMNAEQDKRLSALLHKQQAGKLSEIERSELQTLMQVYELGLVRKAEALAEAVRRGLHKPLEP